MRHAQGPVVGALVLAGLVAAGAAFAASVTSIEAIVNSPGQYDGKQVTVIGTVTAPSLTVRGESLYTLLGTDRTLSVLSRDPAPAVGARLQVGGKIGRPDEAEVGLEFPPTLLESSRTPAP